jgi:hypothetical protein
MFPDLIEFSIFLVQQYQITKPIFFNGFIFAPIDKFVMSRGSRARATKIVSGEPGAA